MQVRDSRQRLGGRWSPLRERNLAETCPQGPRCGPQQETHSPQCGQHSKPALQLAQLHTIIEIAQNTLRHMLLNFSNFYCVRFSLHELALSLGKTLDHMLSKRFLLQHLASQTISFSRSCGTNLTSYELSLSIFVLS